MIKAFLKCHEFIAFNHQFALTNLYFPIIILHSLPNFALIHLTSGYLYLRVLTIFTPVAYSIGKPSFLFR